MLLHQRIGASAHLRLNRLNNAAAISVDCANGPSVSHPSAAIVMATSRSSQLPNRQAIGQGYLLSSLDIFYFSAWLVLLLIPLCWLVRRPAGGSGAVAVE